MKRMILLVTCISSLSMSASEGEWAGWEALQRLGRPPTPAQRAELERKHQEIIVPYIIKTCGHLVPIENRNQFETMLKKHDYLFQDIFPHAPQKEYELSLCVTKASAAAAYQ